MSINLKAIVLPDSKAVREKVNAIFAASGRKVAVVAFVGADAVTYLGSMSRGAKIYCWPRAGGTNPDAIRELIHQHDCKVYFVDKLHMKIFWSRQAGCVIGSANLTNNALGEKGLREAGVFMPNSAAVKIDQIIKNLPVQAVDAKSLDKLDRAHKEYYAKNRAPRNVKKLCSYLKWYEARPQVKWKLGWWSEQKCPSEKTNSMAREKFDGAFCDLLTAAKGNYVKNDWILMYKLNRDRVTISGIKWHYVERLILSSTDADEDWPYEAVQFRSLRHFVQPPFEIDANFKKAFNAAAEKLKKRGQDCIKPEGTCVPPKRLVKQIADEYSLNP